MKIEQLQCLDCLTPHAIGLCLRRVGFALGNFGSETAFAWIRKILRRSDAHVGKVTIGKPCKGSWTPDTELLDSDLGIREGRCLLRNVSGGLPRVKRRGNFRISPLHFPHQFLKRARRNSKVLTLILHWSRCLWCACACPIDIKVICGRFRGWALPSGT